MLSECAMVSREGKGKEGARAVVEDITPPPPLFFGDVADDAEEDDDDAPPRLFPGVEEREDDRASDAESPFFGRPRGGISEVADKGRAGTGQWSAAHREGKGDGLEIRKRRGRREDATEEDIGVGEYTI